MFNEFDRHAGPLIHAKWQEAQYLDLWSIVHLLSGMVLAMIISFFGLSFWFSVFVAFILMVLWEFFESAIGIGEHATNLFTDLVVGLIGYFAVVVWVPEHTYIWLVFVLIVVIGVLDWVGFKSYKKRVRG